MIIYEKALCVRKSGLVLSLLGGILVLGSGCHFFISARPFAFLSSMEDLPRTRDMYFQFEHHRGRVYPTQSNEFKSLKSNLNSGEWTAFGVIVSIVADLIHSH